MAPEITGVSDGRRHSHATPGPTGSRKSERGRRASSIQSPGMSLTPPSPLFTDILSGTGGGGKGRTHVGSPELCVTFMEEMNPRWLDLKGDALWSGRGQILDPHRS
ncbi:hypothetical protein EYF80_044239 [Liparis tanakae]|uniref:Uncharacterized protein n=1 Tax=Liparis tanakae TaxID=230148 RepID=A0A4Z2FYZ9_9TELE|nr:hypothetical protein EYF80_044239 [Liparis tanakae]